MGLLLAFVLSMLLACGSLRAAEPGCSGRQGIAQNEAMGNGAEACSRPCPGIRGDWRATRRRLAERGLRLDVSYVGEFVRNLDAGLVRAQSQTMYQDNLELTATLDTERAGMWRGGTLFLSAIRNHGGDPSAGVIGDIQTVSNIEAPDQFIVYAAWLEQRLAAGLLSLRLGLYDLDSEFYVSEYGGLFLNSSFGIGPELSSNVSASIFPRPGLGARLRVQPSSGWYAQAAVLDGNPRSGALSAAEGGMLAIESGAGLAHGRYKAGYWMHSANKRFNGRVFGQDYGFYALADQRLLDLSGGGDIAAFMQVGWTPAGRNQVWRYVGGGLLMHGVMPRRGQADVGIAIASAATHQSAETSVELTYRLAATSWLAIQPSMQWIIHPGGSRTAAVIRVVLLRFEISL